jgi:hypothetical protein
MQEGDLVGALQKTLDLIGQLRGAALQGPLGASLVPLLDQADGLLRRGVVQASYQWAVGGLPGPDEAAEQDWEVRLLPDDEAQPVAAIRDRRPRRRVPAFVKRRGGGARPTPRPRAAGRRRA